MKAGRVRLLAAALLLSLPAALCGGGTKELTSSDFSAGEGSDFEVRDGLLTLFRRWSFGGQGPDQMEARSHSGFAFDESRGTALLFGGRAADGNALGDTWLWSAGVWTRKTPVGAPSARYGHALVWAGGRFLLFGGNGLSDTWTYDIGSDTWTLVRPPESPAARDFPVMAYDPDLGRAVLFGGGTDHGTWIYDVAAGTWSALAPSPSPPDRHAAAMAYDRAGKKMILFGGRTPAGVLLNDTWAFDVQAGTWTDLAPASRPAARWQSAASYDTLNGGVFLYGGFTTSYSGDLWYYNFSANKWSQHYELDPEESAGRYAHGLVYDTPGKRAVIFGGIQDTAVKSMWLFHFRSSAVWTSQAMDPWAGYSSTTALTWDSLSASFGELPDGAGALLQLASSPDGVSYGLFRGPDGSTGTFYTAGSPAAIWPGHSGDRYMKLRTFLFSTDPPGRPKISALRAGYDRAPFAPAPASPSDGSRINDPAPLFSCAPASDPDGIFTDWPLLYHIQASTGPDFSAPAFSIENVAVDGSYASTAPAAALREGLWYWRARAKDPAGLYGNWSPAFSVFLDTHTPPSPVTVMSAARGPAVNSAAVNWTFPGDDKGRVDGGTWRVRYSSSGALLTEEEWAAAAPESAGVFSAAPGDPLSVTIPGLPGGTTFFFALRTEDELGNLSEMPSLSPWMKTDSSPTVTLIEPNGGGFYVMETTVSWTMSDPDEDALSCSLYLSSDSGETYPILIAAGLPAGTTSYLWDSAREPNGGSYRVKVTAVDVRGLYASDASDSDFRAENTNSIPSVSFVSAPGSGEEVSGTLTFSWSVSDPNDADDHVCSVHLSGNSGSSYSLLAAGLPCSEYSVDTRSLPNSPSYRLRVVALDSGTPALSGAAESPVFGVVNTLPPGAFELIRPLEDTLPSVFDLRFSWSAAADPEGGPVTYSLRYSTTPGPEGGTSVDGLSLTGYSPAPASIMMDTEYYWRVTARDQYLRSTDSRAGRFTVHSLKARSSDGLLLLEVRSGLPAQGYLAFRDARTSLAGPVQEADRGLTGNRLVKAVSAPVWEARVQDLDGNALPDGEIAATLTFTAPGAERTAAVDQALADIQHLKIARLDRSGSRWEIQPLQRVDAGSKSVSADVTGLSVFSVLASLPLSGTLSGLTAFPNPFAAGRETVRIRYSLLGDSEVKIRIYTPMGDLVRVLGCPYGAAGCGQDGSSGLVSEMEWDGRNGEGRIVANGMYTAEIRARSASGARKELLNIGVLK